MKPPERMLGDKAYDSAELREELDQRGTKPVIPNRCNRKQPFAFSKRLYKLRWRIESAFNRLKDFRRIATHNVRMSELGVRRGKAAFFQWVQGPPGNRSSRKQPEQPWR